MTLYHVTLSRNVRGILQRGLVPRRKPTHHGMWGGDVRQCKNAIFAFENMVDALKWAFKMEWGFKKPISVVAFEPANLDEWRQDMHWESVGAAGRWLCKQGPEAPLSVTRVLSPDEWKPLFNTVVRPYPV